MAYNLQPLITILHQILNPQQSFWFLDHNKPQLQSLLQKAASLQQILEKSSHPKNIESLESQIREAANKAQDIIESQMVDQILSSTQGVSFTFSTPDLQQVMQQLDSVMEQVVKLMQEKMIPSGSSLSGASSLQDPSSKSVVVGVDEDLMRLKDRLTGMQSKLEILPIVGMGGIGKTTLARKLYEDPSIVSHFEYACAWTTISQDYNMRAILLSLLRCIIGKESEDHIKKGNGELKVILYRSLYGRRYMIVLDDIWSTKFWDEIRMYFPDNNNRSRIVITTRESDVAKYADSKCQQHQVQLLNKYESWNLLRQIVFGEKDCPHELQGIGEKIASDCGGLPLAISVIAGLLSKVERSKDVWENIGNNVKAAISESDKQFSNILSLSYNHLPVHLKPCFLYMGAFPKDYEIEASTLKWMWVAEGFVKSNGDKSLEEETEDYLMSLVERNLLLVRHYYWYGKPKRYNMHDLLRDVCMRKADDEKFLCVKNAPNQVTLSNLRRVSIHTSYGMEDDDDYASPEILLTRSFLLYASDLDDILYPVFFTLSLLRVLDVMKMGFTKFPREILQLVNLRYLAIDCFSLPSGISRLCNLQTLIAKVFRSYAPPDLWEMSELRHIMLYKELLVEDEYMKKSVLKKLQTIRLVRLRSSELGGFLEIIPNIKSLGIYLYEVDPSLRVVDLIHLEKLETLRWWSEYGASLRRLKFPSTLRKLSLRWCAINSGGLTTLCALPNLEVLKIRQCAFESKETNEEWEAAEGDEFISLQFLQLESLNLVCWRADETNFPRLRHLVIRDCCYLYEIPSGIGEIPTLQLIELEGCSDSAVASAKQIQEEQQSEYGNYDIQLRIS